MNNNVFISFVTPVFNTAKYLEECIESVLAQTDSSWELILVDDGSTDGSAEICDRYAIIDDRIRVIHKENTGQFDSRVRAIEIAKGVYCTGLDSDDFIDENTVKELRKIVLEKDYDILEWKIKEFTNEISEITDSEIKIEYNSNKYLERIIKETNHSFCNKLVKIELIRNSFNIPQQLRHFEDLIMIIPAITKSKRICVWNRTLYFYRNNIDSITNKNTVDEIFNYIKSYKFLKSFLNSYINDSDRIIEIVDSNYIKCLYSSIRQIYKTNKITKDDSQKLRLETGLSFADVRKILEKKEKWFAFLFINRMDLFIKIYYKLLK